MSESFKTNTDSVLLLHNRAINYRLPLFTRLKEQLGPALSIWFFNEDSGKYLAAKYFPSLKIAGIRFSWRAIIALLFDNQHQVVIIWGSHSLEVLPFFLISKLKGKKTIFWTETWDWGAMTIKDKIYFMQLKFIAKFSDYALYPGKKVREVYQELSIPEERTLFSPDASENLTTIDQDFINSLGLDPDKKHIVFSGRALERKGVHYLVKAFELLDKDKYELCLAIGEGDSSYLESIKKQVGAVPGIKLLDFIPKSKMASYISMADVFVYPSISPSSSPHGEPWGLTLNEAVQLSKPIVSTNMVASAFDLISEGNNGFVVPEKNEKALARAIEKAIDLPKKTVDSTSEDLMKMYSYDNMASGFIEALTLLKLSNNEN